MLRKKTLLRIAVCLGALTCRPLCAQILSSALLDFPSQTESIEYDNLYELRKLPNYAAIRQRFAGKALEQVKSALSELGIEEGQVHEMVVGSSPGRFYGLLSGTFSAAAANARAQKTSVRPLPVEGERLYCPKGPVCLVFLEDSLVAFSDYAQLKVILETRIGGLPRLGPKSGLASLIDGTQIRSPVRGAVRGMQMNAVLSDVLRDESYLNLDWSKLVSNISALSYSVDLDSKAHVVAKIFCQSAFAAGALGRTLDVLGGVQSAAAGPFQNLRVLSSGSTLDLRMDTLLPSS